MFAKIRSELITVDKNEKEYIAMNKSRRFSSKVVRYSVVLSEINVVTKRFQ